MAKKMTLKTWEGSPADRKIDKKRGLKEGSPSDLRADRAAVKQANAKCTCGKKTCPKCGKK